MTQTRIIVSHDRFKVGDEYPWLAERDVVGWWKVLCRKRVQRANINVTHGVTFTGTHGR